MEVSVIFGGNVVGVVLMIGCVHVCMFVWVLGGGEVCIYVVFNMFCFGVEWYKCMCM